MMAGKENDKDEDNDKDTVIIKPHDIEESTPAHVAVEDKSISDGKVPNSEKDEFDDEDVATSLVKTKRVFPIRETTLGPLNFNWFVSIIGLGVLWGLTIFCVTSENAGTELNRWYADTIKYFTWFYIVGNPVMTFFIFWIAYRYGHLNLVLKMASLNILTQHTLLCSSLLA